MTQIFRCGDGEALVGFLYEECSLEERAAISAHLAICATCSAELAMLSGTRTRLPMWTPPDVRLDFRLTGAPTHAPARTAWWQQPLPAWAQLAAAVVIFAVGTMFGMRASSASPPLMSVSALEAPQAIAGELARIDARLRAFENQQAGLVVHTASPAISGDAVLQRVRLELDERDDRLYDYLEALTLELAKNAKAQQESIKTVRVDVENRLDPLVKAVELSSRGNGD